MKLTARERREIHRKLDWILDKNPEARGLVFTINAWYGNAVFDYGSPPAEKNTGPRLVTMPRTR